MHVLEPLLPDLLITPDHSSSDIEAECKALAIVQRNLKKFLQGEIDLETFDGCLESYGIDPHDYWGIVDENIDAVIEGETVLEHPDLIVIAR